MSGETWKRWQNTPVKRTTSNNKAASAKNASPLNYSNTQELGKNKKQQIANLGNDISEREITRAIQKLSNRKSVGHDELTAEISKENSEWLTPILKTLFNNTAKLNVMPKGWLQGVMTFIRKRNAKDNINNYRPIKLTNMVYKIWATITSQRLNPILNLLTEDDQYAYKTRRSTVDILAIASNQLKSSDTPQLILFDISKAFGDIERHPMEETLRGWPPD